MSEVRDGHLDDDSVDAPMVEVVHPGESSGKFVMRTEVREALPPGFENSQNMKIISAIVMAGVISAGVALTVSKINDDKDDVVLAANAEPVPRMPEKPKATVTVATFPGEIDFGDDDPSEVQEGVTQAIFEEVDMAGDDPKELSVVERCDEDDNCVPKVEIPADLEAVDCGKLGKEWMDLGPKDQCLVSDEDGDLFRYTPATSKTEEGYTPIALHKFQ